LRAAGKRELPFNSFGQAILNKLIAEIAANPYPKQAQVR
jgi:hypothetical protein